MCPLTPCMTPLHHVPRTRQTEGARPLSWAPKRGHIQSIPGGEGCSTGPHVTSNAMHDPNYPRPKGKMHSGSAPLVMGPQAGPYSIHSRGQGCSTGPHMPSNPMHDPKDPRAKGKTPYGSDPLVMGPRAGPYSIQFRGEGFSTGPRVPSSPMHDPIAPRAKDMTNRGSAPLVLARRHSDCIPLLLCLGSALALDLTARFLGRRWCGVQNLIQGKVCGIRCWHDPGVGPTLHAHGQWDLGALRV